MTKTLKPRGKTDVIFDVINTLLGNSQSDVRHAKHVTELTLALFNRLAEIHQIDTRGRFLLEIAAMLHDIGWSRTTNGGHHKHSRDMILEADLPGVTDREKTICALVARYHNKAEPDTSRHKDYASLKKKDRRIVSWLAAMLRVGDGLDCLHTNNVNITGCKIDKKTLTIMLAAKKNCTMEIRCARKKGALLEQMAKRDLVFRQCS